MDGGSDKLLDYMVQRFDSLDQKVDNLNNKIVSMETRNSVIAAIVAFLVVNFQNVVSFFKDKHS